MLSAPPYLGTYSTPIAVIQDGRTMQLGTGTFFRVAGNSFLVTAAHVWRAAVKLGVERDLHVFDLAGPLEGAIPLQPVAVEGNLHPARDPVDVAVIELAENVVNDLPGRRFLHLHEVLLRPKSEGPYWVFGFPQETASPIVDRPGGFKFDHFALLTHACRRDVALANYDPSYHLILDAEREHIQLWDGTPADMPDRLEGISGGCIWQVDAPDLRPPDERIKQATARVVGVETSFYRKAAVIKGTKWAAVANILHHTQPHLRKVIEWHLGPPR